MSDKIIELPPEIKAKIEELKKNVSELSVEDLNGVAGGAGSYRKESAWLWSIREAVDIFIQTFKHNHHFDKATTRDYVFEAVKITLNIILTDLDEYLEENWDKL